MPTASQACRPRFEWRRHTAIRERARPWPNPDRSSARAMPRRLWGAQRMGEHRSDDTDFGDQFEIGRVITIVEVTGPDGNVNYSRQGQPASVGHARDAGLGEEKPQSAVSG